MQPARPAWLTASRLWLVLDRQAAAPRTLPEVTKLCQAGGVDAVLCRLKGEAREDVRKIALAVREVAALLGLPFIMSHDVDLALELAAEGVQLGVGDPPLAKVRERLTPTMVIGHSTHSAAEAHEMFGQGAQYVFLGPIFPTPAKLKHGPPLGLDAVREGSTLPGVVVFIGGINVNNVSQIVAQGGQRVAAIGALQKVPDPTQAARELRALLPD